MGLRQCSGDHSFVVHELGAGLRRMECTDCSAVVIDLDDSGETRAVTAPGLFKRSGPTIFSVLGEEQRASDPTERRSESSGPRFAFKGIGTRN